MYISLHIWYIWVLYSVCFPKKIYIFLSPSNLKFICTVCVQMSKLWKGGRGSKHILSVQTLWLQVGWGLWTFRQCPTFLFMVFLSEFNILIYIIFFYFKQTKIVHIKFNFKNQSCEWKPNKINLLAINQPFRSKSKSFQSWTL